MKAQAHENAMKSPPINSGRISFPRPLAKLVWAPPGSCFVFGLLSDLRRSAYNPASSSPDSGKGGGWMFYGGGGLLLVLGIIALVLGYTLIGIVLIILALVAGGFGFYGGRRGV